MRYASRGPALYASPFTALLQQQRERRHHVANVADVAVRRQVAGRHRGFCRRISAAAIWRAKFGTAVVGGLPRADLVERRTRTMSRPESACIDSSGCRRRPCSRRKDWQV